MRVALLCPTVSGFGGMETAIRNLLAGFHALGDEARLFLFGGSENTEWLAGLDHASFGSPRDSRLLRMMGYAYGPAWSILRWKPDAILCADVTSLLMARMGRRLARRPGMPVASWMHFPLQHTRMKEKLHLADLHLAISPEFAEALQAYLPEQRERVFTIYNAVQVDASALVPRPARAEFLYVGRLTWDDHKRVNDLLQAAAMLRGDWRLKLVGAAAQDRPEDAPRLRAYAEELGIADRITWLGWQAEPWRAAGEASALVVTSEHEAFGMVLVEALARGIPVISSACGGGPAVIVDEGQNGWLFPVGDVRRLAARMQQIVDAPLALPAQDALRESARRFDGPAVAARARAAFLATMQKTP